MSFRVPLFHIRFFLYSYVYIVLYKLVVLVVVVVVTVGVAAVQQMDDIHCEFPV